MFNWLSILAGFFYILIGIFTIAKLWFLVELEPNTAYVLGALMILYGCFRIGRAVYRIKQERHEQ